jgi:hypothetical protein
VVPSRALAVVESWSENPNIEILGNPTTGDFNRRLSPTWLLAATIGLAHAAAEEVGAGRMTADHATNALHDTVLRVFGVDDPQSSGS